MDARSIAKRDRARMNPVRGFNRRQVAEEDRKVALLATQPWLADPLRRLEDHPLLQGCLASFDVSATNFERRAAVFDEVFSRATELPVPAATAALLACGDYSHSHETARSMTPKTACCLAFNW